MSTPSPLGTGRRDPDGPAMGVAAETGAPPQQPSLPVGPWLRKNLFSGPFNTALTVAFAAAALLALRGLLNFVFSEERNWDAVRTNLRLLFTMAYPEDQYVRVWVSVGTIAVLAGVSVGLWARLPGVQVARVSRWLMAAGGLVGVGVVLREPSALTNPDGSLMLDGAGKVIRESFGAAMADRVWWWLIAAVLFGAGAALWYGLGDQRRRRTVVPTVPLAFGVLGLAVASAWLYKWGHYGFMQEGRIFIAEPNRTVAMSTKLPWTAMWLLLVAGFAAGRRGRAAASLPRIKALVNLAWLLSPFVLFWVVLRDPRLDWAHVWSTDLPMAAGFVVGGGAVLYGLTRPGIGEIGRIIAVAVVGVAAFNWVAAFAGWYPMLQKSRFSFLLLALAALLAPNFIGERAHRFRLVWAWVVLMTVFHYLVTMANTPSTLETPGSDFLGGFGVTIFVTVFTLIFSFPMGVMLALGRTSKMPIFRVLSTAYIEVMRGVPLITVLFFFANMLNLFLPHNMELGSLAAVTLGFSLFSAAYLAENVRGGLQAVSRSQYEASDAVGLTTVQRTIFIVLPQGLRVSIPPLVSQMIATFKETSLLAVIGIFDFLHIANRAIPAQSEFLGAKREGLLFVSIVYCVFALSMSKYSQRLERRVGLGER